MNYPNFIRSLSLPTFVFFSFWSCTNLPAPVKLVFPNKVNYESFIIANQLGFFKESGNQIEVITVNTGINAAEALTLGSADLAAMGDGPTVLLMAQDKNVSIISRYAKGERIHRIVSDTAIHVPSELLGKRIGVQVGSSTYGAFLSWLENHEISMDKITIVPMDPMNMPEAMKNKQLDAVAGSEPWTLNVEKMCTSNVHELDNLKNEKNHFPHVLLANNKILKTREAEIKLVLRALEKANEFIGAYPDSAAKIASKPIGLSSAEESVCLSRLNWTLGWDSSDLSSLHETSDFFLRSKKITKKPDIQKYLYILNDK